ncbi:putative signal peptidase I [Helianthus annuus]|nr:putative signal peptidase I [Helianthus annuus]
MSPIPTSALPALVQGPSMLPTFSLTNELVLLERISTRNGKAGTGDVVILQSPENPRKFVTKRIIGMEGDKITYIVDPKNSDSTETVIVPKGHVWVQGDNIIILMIRGISGLFLMGYFKARSFGGYGLQVHLDQLGGDQKLLTLPLRS